MKKSEMLDIIDGILLDEALPLLRGIDKRILGALEKAGMEPPKATFLLEAGQGQFISRRLNKWEKEDEKKEGN